MEFEQKPDINTDLNSLCELPEGHKGLHVQGAAAWTGYARHEIALDSDWYANNWPAYWHKSDEVFTSPFFSHTEQPAKTLPFELLSEQ